jgi:hypothetical protein
MDACASACNAHVSAIARVHTDIAERFFRQLFEEVRGEALRGGSAKRMLRAYQERLRGLVVDGDMDQAIVETVPWTSLDTNTRLLQAWRYDAEEATALQSSVQTCLCTTH